MQTLAQAAKRTSSAGEPLPAVWPTLYRAQIRPRRGQVTMIAGPPNIGKSQLALAWAGRLGVPTLYWSADTDEFTTRLRSLALLTGQTMGEIEEALGHDEGRAYYLPKLDQLSDIYWEFDPSPTVDSIEQAVLAYDEMYGQPPQLIVIDNLLNFAGDTPDEMQSMRYAIRALHHISRKTNSALFILHHTREDQGLSLEDCPPRPAITGKLSQLPEMILTLAKRDGFMGVAMVKARNGPADPSGKTAYWLRSDLARVSLEEIA